MYKCYFGIIICFFQHLIIAQQSDSLAKSKAQNIIRFLENKYFGWTAFTGFDGAPAMGNLKKQMRLDADSAQRYLRFSQGFAKFLPKPKYAFNFRQILSNLKLRFH